VEDHASRCYHEGKFGFFDCDCELSKDKVADAVEIATLRKQLEVINIDQIYKNMLECLEILKPLDVSGNPNTLVDLTKKAMDEIDILRKQLAKNRVFMEQCLIILKQEPDEHPYTIKALKDAIAEIDAIIKNDNENNPAPHCTCGTTPCACPF